MNPNTRIIISGYSGDRHQAEILHPCYQHHECPITIASPEDAPIEFCMGHDILIAGSRQYYGQLSIDRQVAQMKAALNFDEEWFLWHDSDSFILKPELPPEWYLHSNVVWSNEIGDPRVPGDPNPDPGIPCQIPLDYYDTHPRQAMHPPWFMHRSCMEQLVKLGPMEADPITPFIDWYYVVACEKLGLQHKQMQGRVSLPTYNQELIDRVCDMVRQGVTVIHSVKTKKAFYQILAAYHNL